MNQLVYHPRCPLFIRWVLGDRVMRRESLFENTGVCNPEILFKK